MKLFDIAAFGKVECLRLAQGCDSDEAQEWRRRLRQAVVLDASSLNDAFSAWLDRGGSYVGELVRVTPPWSNCFVFAGRDLVPVLGKAEWGVHCLYLDKAQTENLVAKLDIPDVGRQILADAVSAVATRHWVRPVNSLTVTLCHITVSFLDLQGALIDRVNVGSNLTEWHIHSPAFALPLFAFQLLHCRNITTIESVHRPQLPRGQRNKSPKIAYHVLSISDTLIKREGAEPSGEHPGAPKHVVRGNFAHYTEENKLFGKYTGMFWRPMHIRGKAEHGIVGKEYAIAGGDE